MIAVLTHFDCSPLQLGLCLVLGAAVLGKCLDQLRKRGMVLEKGHQPQRRAAAGHLGNSDLLLCGQLLERLHLADEDTDMESWHRCRRHGRSFWTPREAKGAAISCSGPSSIPQGPCQASWERRTILVGGSRQTSGIST